MVSSGGTSPVEGSGKTMNILVVNCGSSSIKYRLIDMSNEKLLAKGLLERIGERTSVLTQEINEHKRTVEGAIADHDAGMRFLMDSLLSDEKCPIKDISEIAAVGHRVVHGAEAFVASVRIDEKVIRAIEDVQELAPLHNPPNLTGIRAAMKLMPDVPQVAVFDTSFHQTMPDYAFMYPLPYAYYREHRIRRYGFHGTSHRYVTDKAAKVLGKPVGETNVITCHLGNGCSMAAVRGGKSVDTTMGLTPLEGLMMGTRCGDVDPAITFFLSRNMGMTLDEIDKVYNKKSGLLGISETSNDMRDISGKAKDGDARARLALEMFTYRVRKYIGAYMAVLGRTDAVVFAGGIGENCAIARQLICQGLEGLGIRFDPKRNENPKASRGLVSTDDSTVKLIVILTNEEIMIARDTVAVAFGSGKQ